MSKVAQLNEIASIIEGLVDSNGDTVFKQVVKRATDIFKDGYPGASIKASESPREGERVTNRQNCIYRQYKVRIFWPGGKKADEQDAAWLKVANLVEMVANAIEDSVNLNGETLFLYPVDVPEIDKPITGSGGNVVGELNVRCKDIRTF